MLTGPPVRRLLEPSRRYGVLTLRACPPHLRVWARARARARVRIWARARARVGARVGARAGARVGARVGASVSGADRLAVRVPRYHVSVPLGEVPLAPG